MEDDYSWVLGLPAPSLSRSVRPQQPKKKEPRVNEKNDEATHWNILNISQAQDIGEEVLTYFQNIFKSFENSNGHTWMGKIISAGGDIFHPILDTENSPAPDKDIGEEVLTYFQNIIKSFESSNGHTWMGKIISAGGDIFHPILDTKNSPDKDLCTIITLEGTYVISEDGQVQQSGPLKISCARSSYGVIGGLVIDRLIAAEDVKVTICAFHINPSEDEEKV